MNRNLDGIYFRVQRDGKWQNICLSDMTNEEREMLKKKSPEFLVGCIDHLCELLQEIGEQFDLIGGYEE